MQGRALDATEPLRKPAEERPGRRVASEPLMQISWLGNA